MCSEDSISGYGPSPIKIFDGEAENYAKWEMLFKATLRLRNLHLAFDENKSERTEKYTELILERDKRAIFDYLVLSIDGKSLDIIRNLEKQDGVICLQKLRAYHMREEHEFISKCTDQDDVKAAYNEEELILVDSGCTSHVIKDGANFNNFAKDFKPKTHKITLADGSVNKDAVKAIGKATEILVDSNGKQHDIIFENALHIPDFKESIFSVYRSVKNGHTVVFSPEESYVMSKGGTKFNLIERNKLYYLKKENGNECNQTEIEQIKEPSRKSEKIKVAEHTLKTWHRLLGHCNIQDVKSLVGAARGMKITDAEPFDCVTCILGKTTNKKSKIPRKRCSKVFQLVHCDLTGPVKPEARGGFRFGINFVDDFSGATKIYLLKKKSDASEALKKFIADSASYGKITAIRCDNGTEFTGKDWRNVCLNNGIKLEFSSPRSPFQNGTAERNHRTMYDMARCLLLESGLPKSMWGYAIKMAVHIRNRCFSRRIGCTPIEKLTGNKPNLSKLHIFGSKCYSYKSEGFNKLDARCEEGVFVGYDDESPAYYVFFPASQKVKRERLVTFTDEAPEVVVCNSPTNPDQEDDLIEVPPLRMTGGQSGLIPAVIPEEEEIVQSEEEIEVNADVPDSLRRSTRTKVRPKYLSEYVSNLEENIMANDESFIHHCYRADVDAVPNTFKQACNSPKAASWRTAMDEEMASLEENQTYDLVTLPPGRTPVGSRWVYSMKPVAEGEDKFKARFVAKGFTQQHNVDYTETFAPTAKMTSLRLFLQIATILQLQVHQMDVKTAYLHADIDREVYVEQPEGYKQTDSEGNLLYCKLKKSLYGLKQSGRLWNNTIHQFFIQNGFKQSQVDNCVYTKHDGKDIILVLLWVDDIIIASSSKSLLLDFKNLMKKNFKMTDLGQLQWFLGIDFKFENGNISMNQSRYINKLLERFDMTDSHPVKIPCEQNIVNTSHEDSQELADVRLYREIVGSLIYIMTATRPDLSYIVTKLSQFMSNPTKSHLNSAKRVLRYLKGTKDKKLTFFKSDNTMELCGFSDSDWASGNDRKSISGYCFQLQRNGALISWKSKKQQIVALSTCEAEYIALTQAVQEAKFLRQLIFDMLNVCDIHVIIGVDNQSAIKLANNPVNHQRSKHIDVRYHFIRDIVSKGEMKLYYVHTSENVADMFTKPVSNQKLNQFQILE